MAEGLHISYAQTANHIANGLKVVRREISFHHRALCPIREFDQADLMMQMRG
jgi:hypothetical protein